MQAKDRLLFLDSDGTHFNTLTLDKSPIAITKASLEVKVNYCWAIHSNDIALQIAKLIQSKFNAYLGYFKHRKCSQEVYKNIKPQTVIAIILHLASCNAFGAENLAMCANYPILFPLHLSFLSV